MCITSQRAYMISHCIPTVLSGTCHRLALAGYASFIVVFACGISVIRTIQVIPPQVVAPQQTVILDVQIHTNDAWTINSVNGICSPFAPMGR